MSQAPTESVSCSMRVVMAALFLVCPAGGHADSTAACDDARQLVRSAEQICPAADALPPRVLGLRASGDRALALHGQLMADFVTALCGRDTRWLPDTPQADLVLMAITVNGRPGLQAQIGESRITLVEPQRPEQCRALVDGLRSVALGRWSPGAWSDESHEITAALLASAVEHATLGEGPRRLFSFLAESRVGPEEEARCTSRTPRAEGLLTARCDAGTTSGSHVARPVRGDLRRSAGSSRRAAERAVDAERTQADVDLIRRALRARRGLFVGCHEVALARQTPAVPRVVLRFTVEPDGRASSISVRFPTDTPSLRPFGDCLRRVIDAAPFPRARVAAVPVKYPLVFTRSAD